MRRNGWLLALGLGLVITVLWGIGTLSSTYRGDRSATWPATTDVVAGQAEQPKSTSTPWAPTATPVASLSPTFLPTKTSTPPMEGSATPEPTAEASPALPAAIPEKGRFVLVDQNTQLIHIYEDGVEIRTMPCSTGLPGPRMNTPAWKGVVGEYWGTFFAYDVYADDAWYLFKSLGSILIHSSPYTIENGVKVYQDLDALGVRPASHGCIRISPQDARWFTAWGPEGVPIVITPMKDRGGEEGQK